MDIRDKIHLILAKIFSKKNKKIYIIFSILFLSSFIFVHGAYASLGSIIADLLSYLFEIIASLTVDIANVFITIFSSVIQGTGYFVSGSVTDTVWTFVRDIVNMTFIIAMLITAVYKMIGKEDSLAQKKFTQQIIYILIGAFIINFSKVIFGAIVDLTNLISMIFVNSYQDSVSNVFTNIFYVNRLGTSSLASVRQITESILLCIFGLALFAYSATLLFYGVIRLGILTISTMLSPLFIFSFFFPIKIKFIEDLKIKEQFFSFAFGGITVTFFLWVTLMILSAGGSGQLENAVFGTDTQYLKGKVTQTYDDSTGVQDPDFWGSIILKVVAVALLFLGQKTAMSMAKEAGYGANKAIGKIADKVNTVGMAPLNFVKGQAENAADYAKFLGTKAKDSAVGAARNWVNNSDNSLAIGINKAITAADKLRETKEERGAYMSKRADIMKNTSTLEGVQKKREYEQNQANVAGEAIRFNVAKVKPKINETLAGVKSQAEIEKRAMDFKKNREAFVSEKVQEELKKGVNEKEYSIDNVNDNFISALLTAQMMDKNGAMVDVLTPDQKEAINATENPAEKRKLAKSIYDGLPQDMKLAVENRLKGKYNQEVSDRKEKEEEIKKAYDSGNVELGQKLAMDVYNSGVFVNKSNIDRAYNAELDNIRGANKKVGESEPVKLKREERAIKNLEKRRAFIQEQIELGKGTYTKKDLDTIDSQIVEQKKKLVAEQEREKRKEVAGTLRGKKHMSKEEIEALINRDKKYKEMGGDAKLASLEEEERITVKDSDYLNDTSKESLINGILSDEGSDKTFEERLQEKVKAGEISYNLANWIRSKREGNNNITLDELRGQKKTELSNIRSDVDKMKALRLNDNERNIVDTSYESLQKARKEVADANKAIKKQQEAVAINRQKAAGVFEEGKSEKWDKIKSIQSKLKETYIDENGRFNPEGFGLESFLVEDDLNRGKYTLQPGLEEDFAAAMALKVSNKARLSPLEQQILKDRGITDSVMKYINRGNDNVARQEWNKQIEKFGNSEFITRFKARIIETKPTIKTLKEREEEEIEKYSKENIENRVVEYLSSEGVSKFKDTKGSIKIDKLQNELEAHFGGLNFGDEDLLNRLFHEAEARNNDLKKVKEYNGKTDDLDIIKSIESLKNMYLRSRATEYREKAKSEGIKDKKEIDKYVEKMAYKDVMETFNQSVIHNNKSGLGKAISDDMNRYGYDKNNEEAFASAFINATKGGLQRMWQNASDEILSQFASSKTGNNEEDRQSLIKSMLLSEQLKNVLASQTSSTERSKTIESMVNSLSKSSGLSFTTNTEDLMNYLSKQSSSTTDVYQKQLLESIIDSITKETMKSAGVSSESIEQIAGILKDAITTSGNNLKKLLDQLIDLKDVISKTGNITDEGLEDIVHSVIVPQLLGSGKVNSSNLDEFIKALSKDQSSYSSSIARDVASSILSNEILSQFASSKTGNNEEDRQSLIKSMLLSEQLKNVLASQTSSTERSKTIESMVNSLSKSSGLSFTTNTEDLMNYLSKQSSSTTDVYQKQLLESIIDSITKETMKSAGVSSESIEQIAGILKDAITTSGNNLKKLLDQLIDLKDVISKTGNITDEGLEDIVHSVIVPQLLGSGKVNSSNLDEFIKALSKDQSSYSSSIARDVASSILSNEILSQFASSKTGNNEEDRQSLIKSMLLSEQLKNVLASQTSSTERSKTIESMVNSLSKSSGLSFTTNTEDLMNYLSKQSSSTTDVYQKQLLESIIDSITKETMAFGTASSIDALSTRLAEEFDTYLDSIKGSLDSVKRNIIESKLGDLNQGINNLNMNLSNYAGSKEALDSIHYLEQSINELKKVIGKTGVDSISSFKELERQLSDFRFMFEKMSEREKDNEPISDEAKKNEFEFSKKTIAQIRRLLDELLGHDVTKDKTIKESVNSFAGKVTLDKDFTTKLYDIARGIDKSVTPYNNEANKTILLETIKNINDISILKELLNNIDKNQKNIIEIINQRIKYLANFNSF